MELRTKWILRDARGWDFIKGRESWGGGEGTHAYATGNSNNAIGFGTRAAGTVGLRGVF